MNFNNRLLYANCCLSTAASTLPADLAALADSVADRFYVPGHAGCASCMRCRLGPRQCDFSEPRGITSRRLSPVCCRLASNAAQSQANEPRVCACFLMCLMPMDAQQLQFLPI